MKTYLAICIALAVAAPAEAAPSAALAPMDSVADRVTAWDFRVEATTVDCALAMLIAVSAPVAACLAIELAMNSAVKFATAMAMSS